MDHQWDGAILMAGVTFQALLGGAASPPLDQVTGVTISGAWGIARPLLSSFIGQNRGRVRDTTGAGTSYTDFATPADAAAFLGGDAGAIVNLYDHSSNTRTLTNATVGKQPAFSSAIGPNSRAEPLDNTDDYLATAANMSAMISLSSWYMACVVYLNALAGTATGSATYQNQIIWGNGNGGYIWLDTLANGTLDAASYLVGNAVTGAGAVSAAVPVILEWRRTGGKYGVRINGATWVESASLGDPSGLAYPFQLGSGNTGLSKPFNGTFFEGYVCSAEPAQSAAVVGNMKSYYGVP